MVTEDILIESLAYTEYGGIAACTHAVSRSLSLSYLALAHLLVLPPAAIALNALTSLELSRISAEIEHAHKISALLRLSGHTVHAGVEGGARL